MSDCTDDGPVEFGVLFVAGFKHQRPGSAVASLAAALYRWLFQWNARKDEGPHCRPTLRDLSGAHHRRVLRSSGHWLAGGHQTFGAAVLPRHALPIRRATARPGRTRGPGRTRESGWDGPVPRHI